MAIRVYKPGLLTTVQDEGRFGLYSIGFPPSGAMDKFAYRTGAMLVGNEPGLACLEATYMGPELEFTEAALVALTGGEMPAKLNGEPVPYWEAFAVAAGDVLSFDFLVTGARTYISANGGIDVEPIMGSRSTYTLTGIGGFEGRSLQERDEIPVGSANGARPGRRVPDRFIPSYGSEVELRIVVGLCSYRMSDAMIEDFLGGTWTVTPDADRIGYRFRGIQLEFIEREQPFGAGSDPSNVVDMPYPLGSIQVPAGVEPILLLADAVTGGGYAQIGTVISADLSRAAQTRTGDRVRFTAVTVEEALRARTEAQTRLVEIERSLSELS
jgi:biotin-dependent carboxylase-like uncharacterized protein